MRKRKFAAFILTHGRPDRVYTIKMLRKSGYTGPIYLIVDDEDETVEEYKQTHENVIVFSKKEAAEKFDVGDNFPNRRGVVYARNMCFDIAHDLGIDYFIELDDDYTQLENRFDSQLRWKSGIPVKTMDAIIEACLDFLDETGAHCIAFAQGGDYIGGEYSGKFDHGVPLIRKVMNTFICRTDRPFKFYGRINEDTTMYVVNGMRGMLFFTFLQISIVQRITQSNPGGLTELYLDAGTYVKTFYTVMYQPSSVSVSLMGDVEYRLHHRVDWNKTVPKIIPQSYKK